MAQQKDLFSRLTDAGEEAISKLAEVPGSQRVLEVAHGLRGRIDELQKRLRVLDPLERRVTALEKKLAALEKKGSGTATKAAAKAKPKAAAAKTTTKRAAPKKS